MQEPENIEEYILVEDEKLSWKGKVGIFLDSKYFIVAVIILVAIISFCLGKISGIMEKREEVKINNITEITPIKSESLQNVQNTASVVNSNSQNSEQVVASKNGTKYHYPWCAGAKQISEKNKIVFDSIEAARAAGYLPANNCKGLK